MLSASIGLMVEAGWHRDGRRVVIDLVAFLAVCGLVVALGFGFHAARQLWLRSAAVGAFLAVIAVPLLAGFMGGRAEQGGGWPVVALGLAAFLGVLFVFGAVTYGMMLSGLCRVGKRIVGRARGVTGGKLTPVAPPSGAQTTRGALWDRELDG
jgi:hypothetical protein